MITCSSCKHDKDDSEHYPNNLLCKDCINLLRRKRPAQKRKKAEQYEREQASILNLVKTFQTQKESYVYLLESGGKYKIGYSNNIESRVRTFNTASPIPHKVVAVAPGGKQLEESLHTQLKRYRVFGEWFDNSGPILETFKNLSGVIVFLPGNLAELASSQPSVSMGS